MCADISGNNEDATPSYVGNQIIFDLTASKFVSNLRRRFLHCRHNIHRPSYPSYCGECS
jgi:hypothetical protein